MLQHRQIMISILAAPPVLICYHINDWRLKCRSCASDCSTKELQLFDVRHGVKKRCQTWNQVDLALNNRCHARHRFFTQCVASKICRTLYLQALTKLRQMSLQSEIWLHQQNPGSSLRAISMIGSRHLYFLQHLKAQMPKLCNWLQVRSSAAFWRQTWRQKTMPDMASGSPSTDCSVPCLAPLFDAMSGVKKLPNFVPVINCTASAFEPSFIIPLNVEVENLGEIFW